MKQFRQGGWLIALVCVLIGFMIAVQFRTAQDGKGSLSQQRIEEISDRLLQTEHERDELGEELRKMQAAAAEAGNEQDQDMLRYRAALVPLEGEGVIVRMDDSAKPVKAGENPNLYVIHDDDLLRVINELRAAGAEAISVNGQRLTGISEIRCAGPTLSVNNVRSSAPFEIRAIGDKKSLENSLRMRGGVVETLSVWGIQLAITVSDDVYIPAYRGSIRQSYARETTEREEGMIYIVLVSLVIGLLIGYMSPIVIPLAYSKLFSVALVAALDAAFGGLRAAVAERFDKHVFVTGFFSNTLLAAALVFIGDRLGIDLYYVALLAFGFRIFKNLAILRRYLLKDYRDGVQ